MYHDLYTIITGTYTTAVYGQVLLFRDLGLFIEDIEAYLAIFNTGTCALYKGAPGATMWESCAAMLKTAMLKIAVSSKQIMGHDY